MSSTTNSTSCRLPSMGVYGARQYELACTSRCIDQHWGGRIGKVRHHPGTSSLPPADCDLRSWPEARHDEPALGLVGHEGGLS